MDHLAQILNQNRGAAASYRGGELLLFYGSWQEGKKAKAFAAMRGIGHWSTYHTRGVVFVTSPHGYPGIAGNAGNRGIPGNTGIEGIRLGIH